MLKFLALLSLFFVVSAFKCSFTEKSKNASSLKSTLEDNTSSDNTAAIAAPSTKVTGPLRVVLSGGVMYGEIKTITADKVVFRTIDFGQGEPSQHDVEETVRDGLVMDQNGEISVPVTVFVEVVDGKFPCSTMITHDPNNKFCNHLVLEVDEIFTKKLATDSDFRRRFGSMIGQPYEADVKNPYFKVADVP